LVSQQHAKKASPIIPARSGGGLFFNLLTAPTAAVTESLLPEHRERCIRRPGAVDVHGAGLEQDARVRKVDSWAAQRAAGRLDFQYVNTGAYCKARQALPRRWFAPWLDTRDLLSERGAGWLALAGSMP